MSASHLMSISLSTKGFANLRPTVYENDFTFMVGNEKYECPSFIAAFLSPRIAALQVIDPTLHHFIIETDDPKHYFEDFLSLGRGSTLPFSPANCDFYRSVCADLRNREVFDATFQHPEEDITCENVVARLKYLSRAEENYQLEVDFCAVHFFELDSVKLSELNFDVLSAIVSHESLQLLNEDSLYDLIVSRISIDSRYSDLFANVRFHHLSPESMRSFIKMINDSFDILTFPIWTALCIRLAFPVSPDLRDSRLIYQYRKDSPLDGIISYLTKRFGGHVMDRDIVSITASSCENTQTLPLRTVADFDSLDYFATDNRTDSWVCWDFKNFRVKPTHYVIRTRRKGDSCHLQSWNLEGSVDGQSWIKLDQRIDKTSLKSTGAIATFVISKSSQLRMIRIRQIGKNSSGNDILVINAFEIFGGLTEPKQ
jgi:hypothetical protein